MRLCVNSFRTTAIAAILVASAACSRPKNYTPLSNQYVQPRTVSILDSLVKEGEKVSKNPEYVYLGCDTLELNKDFSKNPSKFMDKANMIARDKFNDKVCTKEYDFIPSDPEGVSVKKYREYKDMYIDKTAIVPCTEIFTTDSTDMHVPVKYLGRVNPEVANFL